MNSEINFENDQRMAENVCGRAVFFEILQASIIFQRFLFIRKLVLQEHFRRHIQKYAFLCDAIELKQSVENTLEV